MRVQQPPYKKETNLLHWLTFFEDFFLNSHIFTNTNTYFLHLHKYMSACMYLHNICVSLFVYELQC